MSGPAADRGQLRVYLGAAPGVGKTYHMLDEARRRAQRGADVVIAVVETHGRPRTAAMIGDLEVVPRVTRTYRGAQFAEMDLDAVLARRPGVAVVDEMAHTNVPGGRHAKRWQDIEELLAAGVTVLTTVNIQHLESLNDVVGKITGVRQRETLPDEVLRAADQIEMIDMSPQALQRRMAHGNIYPPEKIDAALSNYFRLGNLAALRELALLWLADRVDEGARRYRAEHGIEPVWETRERVVVALTGGAEGETLIRRAARIAARSAGGDLLAVHVARGDGLAGASPAALADQRRLTEALGGSYHQVVGDDVPAALLQFARAENATQLVLGASRRGHLSRFLTGRGIGETTVELSGDIDVHMVTHERSAAGRRLPLIRRRMAPRRQLAVLGAAVVAPLGVTAALAQLRGELTLTSQALLLLLTVVAVARLGGLLPALCAAVSASALLNFFFIPPFHSLTIADPNNVLALAVFAIVAVIVSSVVDMASRQTSRAAHASAEAETLATLAGSVLRGQDAIPALLERARETFGMDSVALLEARGPAEVASPEAGGAWSVVSAAGPAPCETPRQADVAVPLGESAMLALRGRDLPASDRRVLAAFASHLAVALEQGRLAQAAAEAKPLVAANRMRTALLAAVSHDLRTPLAAAKAAVTSLRGQDVEWSARDAAELLATADESLDRLTRLVENLLDMSRLQAGALRPLPRPVALDEVVPAALDDVGADPSLVRFEIAEAAPPVLADPALLERVVANLVSNALRHNPPGQQVRISVSWLADRVELRVVDRGVGILAADRERVFQPFQRLGDRDNATGVGLGLALSRGLTEAMGGTLTPDDTPGGGLTMIVSLPAAGPAPAAADEPVGGAAAELGSGPVQPPARAQIRC